MPRFRPFSSALLSSLSVAVPAGANGRFPSADLVVFDPADEERLVVRTTFGLLESRDSGKSFDWICEEALSLAEQEDPMLALTENGTLVAATVDGILVGARDECGFRRPPGLAGETIPDLALDRGDPKRIVAFRALGLPEARFDSQLLLSEDEGESFSDLGEPLDPSLLPLSVDVAASDGQRVYLTARLPRTEDYASVLLRSLDGGEHFDVLPIEGTDDLALAFIAGLSSVDPETLYVRIADPNGTRLVMTRDGGDTFEEIFAGTGSLLGFALSPDAARIAFGGPNDGIWVGAADGSGLEQRSEISVRCLGWSEQGLFACSDSADFAVGRSDDEGDTFQSLLRLDELCGSTRCDADSEVGRLCGPSWDRIAPRLGATCNVTPGAAGAPGANGGAAGRAGAAPSEPRGSSGGCGMARGGSVFGGAVLAAVAFAAARARRRLGLLFGLTLSFHSLACSDAAGIEPYTGPPAYPNQRAPFASDGRRLGYVSNSLSDTIGVVDLDAFEVLAEVPVGRDPVGTDGPHHLAIDRERGFLYVALSYPTSVVSLGPHSGHGTSELFGYVQRLALDDLRPLGEARVDASPGDIVLSPTGDRAVVSHYDLLLASEQVSDDQRRATLVWFEPASELGSSDAGLVRTKVCIAPHGIAFSADAQRVFVACTGEDSIFVVDLESRAVVEKIPVADAIGRPGIPVHEPYAIVADAAAERAVVSNLGPPSVAMFTLGEVPARVWSAPVLGVPYFAAWLDDARVLVPLQFPSGAAVLDAETGELLVEASYAEKDCENPHEVVVTADARVFVVCEGDHVAPGSLVELDPETFEIRRRLELGIFPDRLVLREP